MNLGTSVDADNGTLQDDDEDGIASFSIIKTDNTNYTATVNVTNTLGSNATLVGWIDFDQSGTFDADEATIINNLSSSGNQTLTWNTIPADIKSGATTARFRLSTDASLTVNTATGALNNGEVEDYQINIINVIKGTASPDSLIGTSNNDQIAGYRGQDLLTTGCPGAAFSGGECFDTQNISQPRNDDPGYPVGAFNFSGNDQFDANGNNSPNNLQNFLGLSTNSLNTPRSGGLIGGFRTPKEGSAIKREITVTENSTLKFRWNFLTNDRTNYVFGKQDFAFTTLFDTPSTNRKAV